MGYRFDRDGRVLIWEDEMSHLWHSTDVCNLPNRCPCSDFCWFKRPENRVWIEPALRAAVAMGLIGEVRWRNG